MKRIVVFLLIGCAIEVGEAQDVFNKAKIALSSKDTAAAFAGFQDAVRAGQKVAEANYYLGVISFARGRIDDAINYLNASLKGNDENVDALKSLGDAYVEKKMIGPALDQYKRAAKLAPKNTDVAVAYGLALLAVDSLDASIRQLTAAQLLQPDNRSVLVALGDAYVKQGVVSLGIDYYKQAIDKEPKDLTTIMKVSRGLARIKQYTEAVKFYKMGTEADPAYAPAYFEMGFIYIRAKQWKNAIPPLEKYTELKPAASDADTLLMKAYFNANKYSEAGKFAEKVLKRDSTNADVWRSLGYALVEQKKYEEAVNAFAGLQRRGGLKPEDQIKLGQALYVLKRYPEATKAYETALAADSANCEPYNNLGIMYMVAQDYTKAVQMFEKKIGCEPNDPRTIGAYLNAGSCYMALATKSPDKNELFAKAREKLFKAREMNPDNLSIHFRIAQYFAQLDSTDQMKAEYDEVIKRATENPEKYKQQLGEAHAQIGGFYFGKKQFGAAADAFRKALAAGYDNASMRITWGQAIVQLIDRTKDTPDEVKQKLSDAQRHFQRGVDLEPNSAQGHFWLGQVYVLSRYEGNPENNALKAKACEEFRKVLRVDPRNEDAKKTMERIGC